MKAFNKINKYYLLLFVVLVVMAAFIVYTIGVVLSSVAGAQEINLQSGVVRVNKDNLERAIHFVYDKDVPSLDVRETVIAPVEEVEDEEK